MNSNIELWLNLTETFEKMPRKSLWWTHKNQLSLVEVYLLPSTLPVLTWDGMFCFEISSFFISVCSENFSALKFTLYSVLTCFDWVAMFNLVVIFPEEIVWKRERLIGILFYSSLMSWLREMSSISFGLMRPPKKNSETWDLLSKLGRQVSVLIMCVPSLSGILTNPQPCM